MLPSGGKLNSFWSSLCVERFPVISRFAILCCLSSGACWFCFRSKVYSLFFCEPHNSGDKSLPVAIHLGATCKQMRPFSVGCRAKNVFSGELAVPRKCDNTPAQLASTSFTGGKLALFCFRRWCINNPRTPTKKNHKKTHKKYTAHCSILAFRTICSTLSWLRCAFFRLRLNFAFELLSKDAICSLLSFVFAGEQPGTGQPQDPPKKKKN